MSLKQRPLLDDDALDQFAGITGIGWTAAALGYLSAALGFSNDFIAGFVTEPQSLLYLGAVLFVATVGLDRLRTTRDGDRE